jgi:hypothetical protein
MLIAQNGIAAQNPCPFFQIALRKADSPLPTAQRAVHLILFDKQILNTHPEPAPPIFAALYAL